MSRPQIGFLVRLITFGLLCTPVATGCGSDDATGTADSGAQDTVADAAVGADGVGSDGAGGDDVVDDGTATFRTRGTVEQVYVWKASKGTALTLVDAGGSEVGSGTADDLGSLVFRKVAPGKGYRVVATGQTTPGGEPVQSGPITVLGVDGSYPDAAFYAGQTITPGFGYITMRDGTTLSYFATLPGPADKGPYPTVVNYSGYSPSKPGNKVVSGEQESLCAALPVLCDAPDDPNSLLMSVAGYATVSVNIRGTGCSGGAYDYFETLQLLDGYDTIEIVAAQPWVAHHKVGMVGLSYPGITQMFVAKMTPPSLAAIVPMSVIGDTVSTLVPGGILNIGFALAWIERVLDKAAPYGQGWEQGRVDAGDTVCAENQLLHAQRVDNVEQAKNKIYLVPEVIDPLNPTLFVSQIEVPVFLSSQWQDEQTGPFFVTLLDQFKKSPNVRLLLGNGVHSDGFAPEVLAEAVAFLDLHVARRKPNLGGYLPLLAPQFSGIVFGTNTGLPEDRWKSVADYDAALAKWKAEPPVQLRMEVGGMENPGEPISRFWLPLPSWPPPATKARRYYFQPDGSMADAKPAEAAAASRFRVDPDAGDRGILPQGGGIWKALPKYDWKADKPGDVVAFVSAPLDADAVMAGTGSVDLWVRVTETGVDDCDLEVTLTEVRPDGQEMLVQGGWLRASHRAPAADATELFPKPSMLAKDVAPLVAGTWTQLRVPIAGFAHVFRKGSRIRVAIDTPGDSRVDWRFDLLPPPAGLVGDRYVDIAHDAARPSSVALPVLDGVKVPAEAATLPACPSLRGQPCRVFTPVANAPAAP
ncbi:MAG: hypothetical protein RIT45_393 [Pseudomonadota bacterium]|jgi:predicted acyl esterase